METRIISELTGWDKNPRNINDKDYQRLKDQITLLGQYKPLLITDDNIVIGGNMRLKVLKELGVTNVWVAPINFIEKDNLWYAVINGEEQKKPFTSKLQGMTEYALSDNDRAGYYSQDMLANLLGEVDIDLDAYAIDLSEPITLDEMLNGKNEEVKEDEAPAVDETQTTSELGKVYQLGRHRLMCGDSMNMVDVEKLMNGNQADMVLTDPPYNTGMQQKDESAGPTRLGHMFNDNYTSEQFNALLDSAFSNMVIATKGDAAFYVCIDWRKVGLLKEKLEKLMKVNNIIVWDKMVHGLGSDYQFTYELIIVGKKGTPEIRNKIGDEYRDIWHYQREMGRNDDHATAKPIGLLVKPINHASKQDDIVLDLFGGSGSTLIAAEQTNRICYMMELDPKYVDVIRKRYWKFINNNNEEGWIENTPSVIV